MDEDKKLKQLLASAQQELNRLTSAQKTLSRKEKTHRKVVFGGEVFKYMGMDIDHDIVIGYLMRFPVLTEREVEILKIRGAEARRLAGIKKLQDKKTALLSNKIKNRDKFISTTLKKMINPEE